MKAICIIRTSTDRQHIEEQTAEVIQMAKDDGFTDEDIEVIGRCGASAIKLDEAYMENMNQLYKRLDSGDVACVYAWAIDRIGRDEVTLFTLKQTLEKKKIQLKIKTPSLTLFNIVDGKIFSVNTGVELAFSLFATMAKQEMLQKKERFARGKRQSGRAERYTGGSVAFGYSVSETGKYIINDAEADIVKKIYGMYLSGKYSLKTLTDEVRKRGIKWRNNKPFTLARVRLILYNTCYIGVSGGAKIQQFPRIISDELYNNVREILARNKTGMSMEQKHNYFANKLIKCTECGYSYSANGRLYRCVKHSNNKAWGIGKQGYEPCDNDVCISIEAMDGLLYKLARDAHKNFLLNDLATRNQYLEEENKELAERKAGLEKSVENYTLRKKRLYDGYADLIYTEDEYKTKIKKLDEEYDGIKNEILNISEQIMRNNQILRSDSIIEKAISAVTLTRGYFLSGDEKDIAVLIKQYVREVRLEKYTEQMQLGSLAYKMRMEMAKMEHQKAPKPDKHATLITIKYVSGKIEKYAYFARRKTLRFYKIDEYGLEVPFPVELMNRDERGAYNDELRLGSEIIRRAEALKKSGVELAKIMSEPHFELMEYDNKNIKKMMELLVQYGMKYKSHEYLAICNIIKNK